MKTYIIKPLKWRRRLKNNWIGSYGSKIVFESDLLPFAPYYLHVMQSFKDQDCKVPDKYWIRTRNNEIRSYKTIAEAKAQHEKEYIEIVEKLLIKVKGEI